MDWRAGPLAIQEVSPPFPAAAPSLVALSGSSLWSATNSIMQS